MNYDAFSHGQIESKIWLCEKLEPYIKFNSTVWVLGSWYNTVALLMHTRKPFYYEMIIGYDNDPNCQPIADKICAAWTIHAPIKVKNFVADVNNLSWENPPDVVINCSFEHFDDQKWFDDIPQGVLVCAQSTNITDVNYPWLVKYPSNSLTDFNSKFKLQEKLFLGVYHIKMGFNSSGYDRFMMIGYK
jgi:hypothetical protein